MTLTATLMEQLVLLLLILMMLASALGILSAWRHNPNIINRVLLGFCLPSFLVSFILLTQFVLGSAIRLLH